MIRLPASLERKLMALFPKAKDREQFLTQVVRDALGDGPLPEADAPETIGGTLHLFTDGGSRGNPGAAAIACVLEDPHRGVTLKEHAEVIGIETNNVAEWRALIEGLKLALHYHPTRLVCHLDSELVVRQMTGDYKVKMATLQPLHEEASDLAGQFSSISFKHIPRADNHRADTLVNKALDAAPRPRLQPRSTMKPRLFD